jgi:cellulose synthase/poly-beta-1,6-N-acetylglucosamine synthase-like glycosyltransferase
MHTVPIILFWCAWGLIFYAYALFPAILAAIVRWRRLSRRRQAPASPNRINSRELPRVAIVVAAHNEAAVIQAKLCNLHQLNYPAELIDIYIGSDGSTDKTNAYLRECHDPRVHVSVFEHRRGKISVLNDLMRRVDADIVIMSDANTVFAPDALKLLVDPFSDPTVGCVSGVLHLEDNGGVSGEGIYWKYESWIKRNESKLGFVIGCNGGIYAIRRSLYQPLPASTVIEDFVISLRVLVQGYRVVLEPRAVATEPACRSVRAEMTRKSRIGAGDWQALGLTRELLSPKYGIIAFAYWGHKVLRWSVPLFMLVSLAAAAFLMDIPVYRWLADLQLASGVVAFAAYQPRVGRRLPKITRPITYFYLMNYSLLCGFVRFVFQTQRVTWERSISPAPSPVLEASVRRQA